MTRSSKPKLNGLAAEWARIRLAVLAGVPDDIRAVFPEEMTEAVYYLGAQSLLKVIMEARKAGRGDEIADQIGQEFRDHRDRAVASARKMAAELGMNFDDI